TPMSNCTPSVLLTPISMLSKSMNTAILSRVSGKTSVVPSQTARAGCAASAEEGRPAYYPPDRGWGCTLLRLPEGGQGGRPEQGNTAADWQQGACPPGPAAQTGEGGLFGPDVVGVEGVLIADEQLAVRHDRMAPGRKAPHGDLEPAMLTIGRGIGLGQAHD